MKSHPFDIFLATLVMGVIAFGWAVILWHFI